MIHVVDANWEQTGGGCITIWGKFSDSRWFITDLDNNIHEFDADTNEYMDKMFHDEEFDAYEWEHKHIKGVHTFTEELVREIRDILIKKGEYDEYISSHLNTVVAEGVC